VKSARKKADTETIRKVRNEIKEDITGLKTHIEQPKPQAKPVVTGSIGPVEIGSYVQISGQNSTGEVVELHKNKALVALGDLRSWVDIQKLAVVKNVKKETTRKVIQGVDLNDKLQSFKSDLNLIGMRGEDAIRQLQEYIDDAYLLGFKEVRIVHGRGYGILRKLVKEYLEKSPFVLHISHEHIEMGGDGVSIVTLKV
jgi:DNA mismatch repair protein MutS2